MPRAQGQMLPGPPPLTRMNVLYEGTDTIYDGYALCGNSDYGTAATSENSRSVRAEKPASTNLANFLGVADLSGLPNGVKGPGIIPIIVPNDGHCANLYTDLDCTLGATMLAVNAGSYILSNPVYGGSSTSCRVVGVAAQTVDRSTDNDVVLAFFGGQWMGLTHGYGVSANNLQIGVDVSSGTLIPHFLSVESLQTGGDFSVLRIRGELAGAGANMELGALRVEGVINANAATPGASALTAHMIFKTGCTPASGRYAGLFAKAENMDSTPATISAIDVYAAQFVTQINSAPSTHGMMFFYALGTDKPDYWFEAETADSIAFAAKTSAAVSHIIKIKVAGTDYWVMVSNQA